MKIDYVHVHSLTETLIFIETNGRKNSGPLI